jgi:hypothetical protein
MSYLKKTTIMFVKQTNKKTIIREIRWVYFKNKYMSANS